MKKKWSGFIRPLALSPLLLLLLLLSFLISSSDCYYYSDESVQPPSSQGRRIQIEHPRHDGLGSYGSRTRPNSREDVGSSSGSSGARGDPFLETLRMNLDNEANRRRTQQNSRHPTSPAVGRAPPAVGRPPLREHVPPAPNPVPTPAERELGMTNGFSHTVDHDSFRPPEDEQPRNQPEGRGSRHRGATQDNPSDESSREDGRDHRGDQDHRGHNSRPREEDSHRDGHGVIAASPPPRHPQNQASSSFEVQQPPAHHGVTYMQEEPRSQEESPRFHGPSPQQEEPDERRRRIQAEQQLQPQTHSTEAQEQPPPPLLPRLPAHLRPREPVAVLPRGRELRGFVPAQTQPQPLPRSPSHEDGARFNPQPPELHHQLQPEVPVVVLPAAPQNRPLGVPYRGAPDNVAVNRENRRTNTRPPMHNVAAPPQPAERSPRQSGPRGLAPVSVARPTPSPDETATRHRFRPFNADHLLDEEVGSASANRDERPQSMPQSIPPTTPKTEVLIPSPPPGVTVHQHRPERSGGRRHSNVRFPEPPPDRAVDRVVDKVRDDEMAVPASTARSPVRQPVVTEPSRAVFGRKPTVRPERTFGRSRPSTRPHVYHEELPKDPPPTPAPAYDYFDDTDYNRNPGPHPSRTERPPTTPLPPPTTAAPFRPRVAGRPGGRRRQRGGRQRSTTSTTTTTTTTTTTPAPDDYETDYYAEDYDYDYATTTTTQRPRRRHGGRRSSGRRRRPTTPVPTTTTPPPTTTKKLSAGYKERPDGRIIDFNADPNYPRELKGEDLTNYPFYITLPDDIKFKCDGRHDGYYASVEHHCQIYHHCAVGNRYDFLCPNYTLFDQTTFTCRFINTVDCPKSQDHYYRNNALYLQESDAPEPATGRRNHAPSISDEGNHGEDNNRNNGNVNVSYEKITIRPKRESDQDRSSDSRSLTTTQEPLARAQRESGNSTMADDAYEERAEGPITRLS